MIQIVRLVLIFALLIAGVPHSEAEEDRSSLLPNVPKATGEPHPEGNEFWRKNHADLLAHDRDLTVRDGTRNIQASLKSCFECHTTTNSEGTVLTSDSPEFFCSVCHQYVGVRIDCFVCHRSTPDGVDEYKARAALVPVKPLEDSDINGLVAYLNKAGPELEEASK